MKTTRVPKASEMMDMYDQWFMGFLYPPGMSFSLDVWDALVWAVKSISQCKSTYLCMIS